MNTIRTRLAALAHLRRPLLLTLIGVFLLGLSLAVFAFEFYRTSEMQPLFQSVPPLVRGAVLGIAGLVALAAGIWRLSDVAIIPIGGQLSSQRELVLGYRTVGGPPRVVVLSGGPGMLVLAGLGQQSQQMTCITPVQDPVEYYYRAASLFRFENVLYLPPTNAPLQIIATLDDNTRHNIKQRLSDDERFANRSVRDIALADEQGQNPEQMMVFRKAIDAIRSADLIILGPGSLFESILPDLLVPDVRAAIAESKARKIYVCNLMTEPGLTTGFTVGDHIRQVVRYGGFTPDFVLVNAQRIDSETRNLYAAAYQTPVYLAPEEYEETVVGRGDRVATRDIVVEGAVVVEADLASTVVQSTASLERPGEVRAVRVLRHDPEKLTAAILQLMRRS